MTKKIIVEIANDSIHKFSDYEFGELQVIEQNGGYYFVARDVVNILTSAKKSNIKMTKKMTKKMIKTLDKDEKIFVNLEQSGRMCQRFIISESGLYRLINNNSESSKAIRFKKWIISQVLPIASNAWFYTYNAHSTRLINVSEMAAIIRDEGIKIGRKISGRNILFEWLIDCGLCRKQDNYNVPTTYAESYGLMEGKPNTANNNKSIETTLITGKGQSYILDRLLNKAADIKK